MICGVTVKDKVENTVTALRAFEAEKRWLHIGVLDILSEEMRRWR